MYHISICIAYELIQLTGDSHKHRHLEVHMLYYHQVDLPIC